jgi:acetyl-CoA synthetase
VKGEVIVELVILRAGNEESEKLREKLAKHMRTVLGPVAYPGAASFVKDVFKTRPGKIMRRAIKAKALKNPTGDFLSLANTDAFEAIQPIK